MHRIDRNFNQMRVLFYIHSLQTGGAEKIVVTYLEQLFKNGCSVALVVNETCVSSLTDCIRESGIQIYSLMPIRDTSTKIGRLFHGIDARLFDIYCKKKWMGIIQDFKPDLIHIHTMATYIDKIPFPKNRLVFTFHTDVKRAIELGGERAKKNLHNFSDEGMSFFAINRIGEENIKYIFGTKQIYYTPNGIDLNSVRNFKYDKKEFCEENNISEDSFIVGHVGRIHPVKNHKKLLGVFREICKIRSNAILILVGRGNDEEISKLKALATDLGIINRIVFLGDRNDAIGIMSVFDVLVFPSLIEGFPLTILEAQAHGIRCIISDTIPKDVVCSKNCIQVPLELTDSEWASVALNNTENDYQQNIDIYDIRNAVDRYNTYYQEVMNKNEQK